MLRTVAFQVRHVSSIDFPDSVHINAELIVHEDIPERPDAPPFNLWVTYLELVRQSLGRFGKGRTDPDSGLRPEILRVGPAA